MQLTMTGEYAVRAMIHLSALPFGTMVHIADVAKEWTIPEKYLRRISTLLARAELIATQKGPHGGIRLKQRAELLTVLDVIEAVEGRIFLNKCLVCEGFCPRDVWCDVHSLWSEAQQQLKKTLMSRSLAQLAQESLARKAALASVGHQSTAA